MGIVAIGKETLYDSNDSPIAMLSQDRCSLPADASGNVTTFSGAVSTLSVLISGIDDSANWTVTVAVSGLSGSLSGKTYTVTSMTSDSGYVDFTAKRPGYADLIKRFHVAKVRQGTQGGPGPAGQDAPRCRGLFPYLSAPASPAVSDLVVWFSATQAYRGIYSYSGADWVRLTSPTPDQVSRCFLYILDATRQGYGSSSDYAPGSVAFESIFASFIAALQIAIASGGSIRGGSRFDEYGNVVNGSAKGFWLGADGNLYIDSAYLTNVSLMGGGEFGGSINTPLLEAIPAVDVPVWTAPTAPWSGATFCDYFNLYSLPVGVNLSWTGTFGNLQYHTIRKISGDAYSLINGSGWITIERAGTYSYSGTIDIVTLAGSLKLKGTTSVTGNLLPNGSNSFDIGDAGSNKWRYGYFSALYGAVGNDFADALDMPTDEIEPGFVASFHKGVIRKTAHRNDPAALGIISDTYSFRAGVENKGAPIAVAGYVLAHVDTAYKAGTKLTASRDGCLTRAYPWERTLALFIATPIASHWNDVQVRGRSIVKVA